MFSFFLLRPYPLLLNRFWPSTAARGHIDQAEHYRIIIAANAAPSCCAIVAMASTSLRASPLTASLSAAAIKRK